MSATILALLVVVLGTLSHGQGDTECPLETTCSPATSCPSFLAERAAISSLSPSLRRAEVVRLSAMVCNKKEKKVTVWAVIVGSGQY